MLGPTLLVCEVTKAFSFRGQRTTVFESFSMAVQAHEFVSVLGPTGCGKTTLLNLIAGFLRPDAGTIQLNGHRVHGPDRSRAVIFQDDAVFPWYTTAENIGYGLKIRGVSPESRNAVVDKLLKEFGLSHESEKYPLHLSGGQRKRVDLARALANSPEVVLMDEPFGSVDPITKESLYCYVSEVLLKRQATALLVTHDVEEALWMSDRILILSAAPARLKWEQAVGFPRPRTPELRFSSEFQELRKHVSERLRL